MPFIRSRRFSTVLLCLPGTMLVVRANPLDSLLSMSIHTYRGLFLFAFHGLWDEMRFADFLTGIHVSIDTRAQNDGIMLSDKFEPRNIVDSKYRLAKG